MKSLDEQDKSKGIYSEEQRNIFHDRFSRIMHERNISNVDLARRMVNDKENINKLAVNVGRWRNGKNMPDSYNLLGLAAVLDLDVSDLIGSNPWSEYLTKLLRKTKEDEFSEKYIIQSSEEHFEDLQKTLKVLESNTGNALSLHMNINSFHEAVLAAENEKERENNFKKQVRDEMNEYLAEFMKEMKNLIRNISESGEESKHPFPKNLDSNQHITDTDPEENSSAKTQEKKQKPSQ
jgi:transcriptional regulator with XRE-family HTH domain